MNKSLKALLHGYLLFQCNGKFYPTYNRARAAIPPTGPVTFVGWHLWRGWRGFLMRI